MTWLMVEALTLIPIVIVVQIFAERLDRTLEQANAAVDRLKTAFSAIPKGMTRKRLFPKSEVNQEKRELRRR